MTTTHRASEMLLIDNQTKRIRFLLQRRSTKLIETSTDSASKSTTLETSVHDEAVEYFSAIASYVFCVVGEQNEGEFSSSSTESDASLWWRNSLMFDNLTRAPQCLSQRCDFFWVWWMKSKSKGSDRSNWDCSTLETIIVTNIQHWKPRPCMLLFSHAVRSILVSCILRCSTPISHVPIVGTVQQRLTSYFLIAEIELKQDGMSGSVHIYSSCWRRDLYCCMQDILIHWLSSRFSCLEGSYQEDEMKWKPLSPNAWIDPFKSWWCLLLFSSPWSYSAVFIVPFHTTRWS